MNEPKSGFKRVALENPYLATFVAFLSAVVGFFAVIVVGVNFKFLIGGSL